MRKNNKGFTIMELMIAITLLSIILLMSSVVLIGVGNLFAKGVNLANVQDASRNLIGDVTSTIQFSNTLINNNQDPYPYLPVTFSYPGGVVSAYCFGDIRYSFVTGFQSAPHVIWKDQMQSEDTCSPLDIFLPNPNCIGDTTCSNPQSGSGEDMTGADMHLASFNITYYDTQLYSIDVGLVLGQKDMFEASGGVPVVVNGNYVCNTTTGQQYCATSFLTVLASERLTQD